MIKTFTHKGLEDFFFDGTKKGIQAAHAQKLADILDRLDASTWWRTCDILGQTCIN